MTGPEDPETQGEDQIEPESGNSPRFGGAFQGFRGFFLFFLVFFFGGGGGEEEFWGARIYGGYKLWGVFSLRVRALEVVVGDV